MTTPVAIYILSNTANGKRYIGQSVNPDYRMRRHFWANNPCSKLRTAIEKYGASAFSKSVVYWCRDKQDANEVEELLIALCETRIKGYNIAVGGAGTGAGSENPFFGKTHSAETKQLLSRKQRGRKMPSSAKAKIAAANSRRSMSESTKEKLRARPVSAFCSKRTAEANRARKWTEASRKKLSEHNKGKAMSAETRAKIAEANRRRVWSAESRAKLAASKTKVQT